MDAFEMSTLTELLDLDGFEVVAVESDRNTKSRRLTVVVTTTTAPCPHCGKPTAERHACHDRKVVDLPLGGWKTELAVSQFQFRCARCDKFFTPRHPSLAEGAHATERFLGRLADYATHADVSTAARFLGVAEKTAEGWYYDYLKRPKEPAKDLQPVRCLGIDELSLKKTPAILLRSDRPDQRPRARCAGKQGKSRAQGVAGGEQSRGAGVVARGDDRHVGRVRRGNP